MHNYTEIRWDPPKESHEHQWITVWDEEAEKEKVVCMAIWCSEELESEDE